MDSYKNIKQILISKERDDKAELDTYRLWDWTIFGDEVSRKSHENSYEMEYGRLTEEGSIAKMLYKMQ